MSDNNDGNESSSSSSSSSSTPSLPPHEDDATAVTAAANEDDEEEDGEIILFKKEKKKKEKKIKNSSFTTKEFYLKAKEDYEEMSCQLPHQFNNILVLEFGEIKSHQNFYTKEKIYPVGYKCEVTTKNNMTFVVEVVDMDDQLEFLVTLKSSNRVFMASSEADIFVKYVDPQNEISYSIFNLEIELLIEGMEGVLDCDSYVFHQERGYGEIYTNDDEYRNSTTKQSLKESRAMRNRNRQSTKTLSTEEIRLLAENKKKQQQAEAEKRKKILAEEKALRLEAKANAKKRKEQEKSQKGVSKEQNKKLKELQKKEEKVKLTFRKDVLSDMKRNRHDAALQVIQCFDDEQEAFDLQPTESHFPELSIDSSFASNSGLDDLFSDIPTLRQSLHLDSDIDTTRLVDVISFLQSMKSLLRISSQNYSLDYFTKRILGNFAEDTAEMDVVDASPELVRAESTSDTLVVPDMDIVKHFQETDPTTKDEPTDTNDPLNESEEKEAEFEDTPPPQKVAFKQDEVELDRIQLNLIRVVLDDLHSLFGLQDRDDKKPIPRFPLNQLTWPEIARMIIVASIGKDLAKSDDEILNLLRGSKQSHFKQAKNIVRAIRTRMALRYQSNSSTGFNKRAILNDINDEDAEDSLTNVKRLPQITAVNLLEEGTNEESMKLLTNPSYSEINENLYDFTTDQEIIGAIDEISNDQINYSEEYRRCCKVWLRIVNYSQAKNFIWEIDSNIYPDYSFVIKKPMTFSQVALNLLKKSYHSTSSSTGVVTSHFYREMRQVLLNCFTYNTEAIALVSQAQRLLHALHRHVNCWIVTPELPPISTCNDQYCLFSSSPIVNSSIHHVSIRCGRCLGIFSIDALHRRQREFGVILPTQEQVHGSDEWYCMFCLREDSVVNDNFQNQTKSDHFFDEWGPSCLFPWQFNRSHGNFLDPLLASSPQVHSMLEALHILASTNKTSLLQRECEGQVSETISWSLQERLCILTALCEVLKGHRISYEYLHEMYSECLKLSKMSLREQFHEADFLDQVMRISGGEGVVLARSLLEDNDRAIIEEETIKQSVIEGRCLVCKESTFEEDCDGKQVLLCDGCNAEVHIPCIGLTSVPKGSWFCDHCKERMSHQFEGEGYVSQLKDIQSLCSKEEEQRLITEEALLRENDKSSRRKADEIMCSYCGQTELQLCSPMVYGQSRAEFNAYMKYSSEAVADHIFPDQKNTVVKFTVLKQEQKSPEPPLPYFPLLKDKNSKKVRGGGCHVISPIVHEICAYRMFAARVQRSKHEARRKRRLVAERIAVMSGISTQPLGYDDTGRSYWQFPHTSPLFIAPKKSLHDREPERDNLLRQLHPEMFSSTSPSLQSQGGSFSTTLEGDWYVISDPTMIVKLIESLGDSTRERNLRKALTLRFNTNATNVVKPPATEPELPPQASETSENITPTAEKDVIVEAKEVEREQQLARTSKREKLERESVKRKGEGKPVTLRLIPEKGVEMQSNFIVKQENVFGNRDNDGDNPNDDSSDDESYLEYFSFAKPAKYYAIALLDRYDKVVKQEKSNRVTVIFQIQKEGLAHTLAYTPLSEPWGDGIYYFSTLNFKRSGRYTISFFTEGVQMSHIQPLVYVVNVIAEHVSSGPTSAFSRLRAQEYLTHPDRQVTYKRRELLQFLSQIGIENEFAALKSSLITMYLSLPFGSLILSEEDDDESIDTLSSITDASGWNSHLDELWRRCVMESRSSIILMECVLLLEYYISKNWFQSPANRLISSLPSPHFAIRCVTNSSVALRIFCLDKCLSYDRVQSKGGKSVITSQPSSRRNQTTGRSDRNTIPDEVLAAYTARPKRAAMTKAREALSESVKLQLDDGSDEDGGRNLRARAPRPQWTCSECGTLNDDRNRSCVVCGSRRRVSTVAPTTSHLSRAERLGRRRAMYAESDEDSSADSDSSSDNDEDRGGGDRSEEDQQEASSRSRRNHRIATEANLRKRSRVSYREAEEDDDEEDEEDDQGGPRTQSRRVPSRGNKRSRASHRSSRSSEDDDVVAPVEDEVYPEYIPPEPMDIQSLLDARRVEIGPDVDATQDIPSALLTILMKIQDDPESIPFWEPVDTTIYTDYRYQLFPRSLSLLHVFLSFRHRAKVPEPMDMNSVIRRVEVGFYGNEYDDFAKDVRQIWTNCQLYNSEKSPIYASSQRLSEYFEILYSKFLKSMESNGGISSSLPSPPQEAE